MHSTTPVEAGYDRAAPRYARRWAAYTSGSLALLHPFVLVSPRRILDVGCGTGSLLDALHAWGRAPSVYVGLDLSAGMLREARGTHPGAGLARAEAGALPVASAAFDLVVSASSLHDWPDPAAGLREMRRALAPDGRLLLMDWCADYASVRAMRAWLRLTGRPVRQVYTSRELGDVLSQSGFTVDRIHISRISTIWALMIAEARPERNT